jgi:hypothetical protein
MHAFEVGLRRRSLWTKEFFKTCEFYTGLYKHLLIQAQAYRSADHPRQEKEQVGDNSATKLLLLF